MLLKDISLHEARCPQRTVKCPFRNCGVTVKLSQFNDHTIQTGHSILLAKSNSPGIKVEITISEIVTRHHQQVGRTMTDTSLLRYK